MGVFSVEVGQIKESPHEFRLESDRSWWESSRVGLQEEVELREPFALSFQAHRLGLRLLLRGTLTGAVDLICARCLDPYPYALEEPAQLLLEPAEDPRSVPYGGIELDSDDLEVAKYAGDTLDLEPFVNEILALVWPAQPRCSEDCRGLCEMCGCNRNRESCSCTAEPGVRPFAGLASLLKGSAPHRSSEEK